MEEFMPLIDGPTTKSQSARLNHLKHDQTTNLQLGFLKPKHTHGVGYKYSFLCFYWWKTKQIANS